MYAKICSTSFIYSSQEESCNTQCYDRPGPMLKYLRAKYKTMIKNAVIEEKTLNDSSAKDCISGIMCNKASIESEGNTVFESFTMPRTLT